MKIIIKPVLLLALLFGSSALLTGCGNGNDQYNGEYELVAGLDKHAYDQVVIEEILNFNCKPCFKFFTNGNTELSKTYGDKVKLVPIPVRFGDQTEYPIRLVIIANKYGKGKAAIQAIFEHNFQQQKDVFDETIVIEIAQKLGLKNQYESEKSSAWVNEKYEFNRAKAIRYRISSTPSFIIEQQLKLSSSKIENIESLVDELLRK